MASPHRIFMKWSSDRRGGWNRTVSACSHGTGFVPWAFPGNDITIPRHEEHAVATPLRPATVVVPTTHELMQHFGSRRKDGSTGREPVPMLSIVSPGDGDEVWAVIPTQVGISPLIQEGLVGASVG